MDIPADELGASDVYFGSVFKRGAMVGVAAGHVSEAPSRVLEPHYRARGVQVKAFVELRQIPWVAWA
ncbi:hypothetical protein JI59_08690 [Novosphingobium pentaromativorans US6-1]|nr:hypothetical protein JI59_08690 [Novosphingobium pentaromativorans US6-1]